MEVGYNYLQPSNKFGLWLGPEGRQDKWPADYAQRWKDLRFKKEVAANLATLRDNGIRVVRWFLLGNGFNYGMPPRLESLRAPGISGSVAVWHFDPPDRLDPLFLDHFVQLLELHRAAKLQMIPSLVSFEFFATHETRDTAAGGRGEIATDWKKRNKFLFSVLGEFLRVSEGYRDVIRAWEVMNEPAWDVRNVTPTLTGYSHHAPFLPKSELNEFLKLGCAWIKDKKFESTVGHRFLSDLDEMETGSLRQFHYYAGPVLGQADPSTLPPAIDTKGAFIGEFGSLIGKGYEKGETPRKDQYGAPWDNDFPDHRDRDPTRTVYERLKKMKELGYSLALVWPDLKDDNVDAVDGLKLSAPKLAAVKRFVDGK
jgi:hypothetical protein